MVWGQYSLSTGEILNSNTPSFGGTGFKFQKRMERIDWRKMACVDIDRIAKDVDFSALQENISNVTYCNIEQELDFRSIDPNFVKVFKLAQLIIEYLLHSQEYLYSCTESLKQKLLQLSEICESAQKQIEQQMDEIKALKKENKRKKKMLADQQQLLTSKQNINETYQKCMFCEKTFFTVSYLQSHIHRRHGDLIGLQQNTDVSKLQTDMQYLKKKLITTQQELEQERARKTEHEDHTTTEQMEQWKEEQKQNNRQEVERVKEMLLKEMKEMQEKYQASQQMLHQLQLRYKGQQSHLGNLQDTEEELQRKHKEEIETVRMQLQNEVKNIQEQMTRTILEQDKKYKSLMRQNAQYLKETGHLRALFAEQQDELQAERGLHVDKSDQNAKQVQKLLKFTKQQKQIMEKQQREIEELKSHPQPVSNPVDPKKNVNETDSSLSEGESQNMSSSTRFKQDHNQREKILIAMKETPNFLPAMKDELKSLLEETLMSKGIKPSTKGINDRLYNQKKSNLNQDRHKLSKKYEEFDSVRDRYTKEVEHRVKKGTKGDKKKSSLGSHLIRSNKPSSSLLHSPKLRSKVIERKKQHQQFFRGKESEISGPLAMSVLSGTGSYSFTSQFSSESDLEGQPKKSLQKSESESESWDDSDGESTAQNQQVTVSSVGSQVASNGVVAELTKSIEKRIKEDTTTVKKPAVAPRNTVQEFTQAASEESDFSFSSLESPKAKSPQPKPRIVAPPVKPRRSSSGDQEDTKSYGTSIWGSSKGSAVGENSNEKMNSNKATASASWDSDGDFDIEDIVMA